MWRVHRDVNRLARRQVVNLGAVLELLLVDGGIIVYCPKSFDLLLGQNVPVVLIKHTDVLLPMNLKKEIAFPVNVVGGDAIGRRDENNHLVSFHLSLQVSTSEALDLCHAIVEKGAIFGI